MKIIKTRAPAKINLGLSILRKLPHQYHEVKTIYAQISLFDFLEIQEIKENKIIITCSDKNIPTNEKNLIYQMVGLIKEQTGIKQGVNIKLIKNIPVGAGLGGGSSDAAATLKALNQLWQLDLSANNLIQLAKKIGADVAYHLVDGIQLEIQGGRQGGRFTAFPRLPDCYILLCVPKITIQSRKAYAQVDYDKISQNHLDLLREGISKRNLQRIAANLHNDFELWVLKKYPMIKKIKKIMVKQGALGSLMSGKGLSTFAIFDNLRKAESACNYFQNKFQQQSLKVFLVKPFYD